MIDELQADLAQLWTAGTLPSRPGRKAHNCHLELRGGGRVTRQGRSIAEDARQRVDTPPAPQLLRRDLCRRPYARPRRVTHPRTRSAALAAANAELTSGTATPRRAATARAMAPHRGAGRFDGLEGGHSEQASTRRSALFGPPRGRPPVSSRPIAPGPGRHREDPARIAATRDSAWPLYRQIATIVALALPRLDERDRGRPLEPPDPSGPYSASQSL